MSLDDTINKGKSILVDIAVKGAMTLLTDILPIVQLPIIKQLVESYLREKFQYLADKGELAAFMLRTNIITDKQAKEFEDATRALKTLPKETSEEERKRHEQEVINRTRDLIKYKL